MAERACVAVNACRGIDSELLTPGSVKCMQDALAQIEAYAQEQLNLSKKEFVGFDESALWAQVIKLARSVMENI